MSGLTFNEDAARHLARVYLTPDVVAQRAETMKQLALSPGERVLDIGCGPGFLCESIAAAVGSDGAVTGIDISSDLIALCRTRNPPQWLSYEYPGEWYDEFARLSEAGRYFFSTNRYIFRASKP